MPLFRNPTIQATYTDIVKNLHRTIVESEDASLMFDAFIDEWGVDYDPNDFLTEAQMNEQCMLHQMFFTRLMADLLLTFQTEEIGLTLDERVAEETHSHDQVGN